MLYNVYNDLGYGYQEKIYEKAISKYLEKDSINFKTQVPFKISVSGEIIGKYFLDFLIEDKIVLEIKKGNYFSRQNINQVKGYLKATKKKLGILANFTPREVRTFRVLNPEN